MKTMLKFLLLMVMLGLASRGRAQEPVISGVAPVIEWGIGYSYMKSDVPTQGNLLMKGAVVSASRDLNEHFGLKLQVGYSRSFDAFQTGRTADILTYMGGPVFYAIRRSKFDLHVQVLGGRGKRDRGELRERWNARAGIRESLCVGGWRRISIPNHICNIGAAGSRVSTHIILQFGRGNPGAD